MVEGYNVHVCEHAHITYSDYAVEMSKCSECGAPICRTWNITESDDVDAKEDAAEAYAQQLTNTSVKCLEFRIKELVDEIARLRDHCDKQIETRVKILDGFYEKLNKLKPEDFPEHEKYLQERAETAKK